MCRGEDDTTELVITHMWSETRVGRFLEAPLRKATSEPRYWHKHQFERILNIIDTDNGLSTFIVPEELFPTTASANASATTSARNTTSAPDITISSTALADILSADAHPLQPANTELPQQSATTSELPLKAATQCKPDSMQTLPVLEKACSSLNLSNSSAEDSTASVDAPRRSIPEEMNLSPAMLDLHLTHALIPEHLTHALIPEHLTHALIPEHLTHALIPEHLTHALIPEHLTHALIPEHLTHALIPEHLTHALIPEHLTHALIPEHLTHALIPEHLTHALIPEHLTHALIPEYLTHALIPEHLTHALIPE
ncbi:uncharacterized protein [Procambarus clarkii]|uniref:uncharacterized protein n=1 Tax=Procambarus clarkii TaxID=6728 RepID=UPI003743201E